MWRLLYHSLNGIEVIDFLSIPYMKSIGIIEQIDEENQELKKMLTNLIEPQYKNEESEIQRVYAVIQEEKLLGILFGDHVLHLQMQPFYKEQIQKVIAITSTNNAFNEVVERIVRRTVKDKNSIISPKEFEVINGLSTSADNMPFMENTFCLDTGGFSELRLYHLCSTRYFKKIKNEYCEKWGAVIAMKDFSITKLYYKKHLLIGFCLFRKQDGEQFFLSSQFQEVLESLI
jgi:hypothetical protein